MDLTLFSLTGRGASSQGHARPACLSGAFAIGRNRHRQFLPVFCEKAFADPLMFIRAEGLSGGQL